MPQKPKYIIRSVPEKRETSLAIICKKKGITQAKLARGANLANDQACDIWNGIQKDMLLSTAMKICNFVNCNLHAAFKD